MFTWTSACGSGAGPSATAGLPTIQPKASPSATLTAFQLIMVPLLSGRGKARGAPGDFSLGAPRVVLRGTLAGCGGRVLFTTVLFIEEPEGGHDQSDDQADLDDEKNEGQQERRCKLPDNNADEADGGQLHDRLEHQRNSVEGDQTNTHGFAERVKRCRRSGEDLRGRGAGWWRRPHTRQRPACIRPARAQPFNEPQRQRARALERLLADRRLQTREHLP